MKFRFRGKTYKVVEGGNLWWAMDFIPCILVVAVAITAFYLMAGAGQAF